MYEIKSCADGFLSIFLYCKWIITWTKLNIIPTSVSRKRPVMADTDSHY